MPRSTEAKLRRRNRKKADQDEALNMLGNTEWEDGDDDGGDDGADAADEPVEMFPTKATKTTKKTDGDDDDDIDNLPKKKGKKKSTASSTAAPIRPPSSSSGGGIKTTPLILLILMVGTTLLPAIIYAGDYLSKYMSKNDVIGSIGFRLGIGAVPKRRVLSFYEKHAPEKLEEVPKILSKHYGNYPQLIKKLERKYQDYGYFMGWEEDEASLKIVVEQLQSTYDVWISQYWNRYAPQQLKTAFRNIRYNLTTLHKKGTKIWKKKIWPYLEPVFGAPGNAAAQKRKDAAEARKLKQAKAGANGGTKTRRRSHEYRDDVEED